MKLNAKQKKILLISVPAVLVIAIVTMALAGVFGGNSQAAPFFERPFIKSSQTATTPATLSELLNVAEPSLDILLAEDKLQAELLAATNLTDVVNSRLSLSGLRTLQDAADALTKEREEQAALFAETPSASSYYVRLAQASAADSLPALRETDGPAADS